MDDLGINQLQEFARDHIFGLSAALSAVVSLAIMRRWLKGPVYKGNVRLDGKTVVVTGANSGIGYETSKDLLRRGASLVLACRNEQKAQEAVEKLKKETGLSKVRYLRLDLASLESAKECARKLLAQEKRIDIIINNAGVYSPEKRLSKDGYEFTFASNHLGHFYLTNLLLDRIKESAPARIINVSSEAHYDGTLDFEDIHFSKKPYDARKAYNNSKLANVMFTRELHNKLRGTGVYVYSLHPGVILTNIFHETPAYFQLLILCFSPLFKTPFGGAQNTIFCALDESIESQSGQYFKDFTQRKPHKKALDETECKKLWEESQKMIDNSLKS